VTFENLKAGIALLLDQMNDSPGDAHEIQENLREKLSEMRALGLPLPEDLVELERRLNAELSGRKT